MLALVLVAALGGSPTDAMLEMDQQAQAQMAAMQRWSGDIARCLGKPPRVLGAILPVAKQAHDVRIWWAAQARLKGWLTAHQCANAD